MATLEMVLRYHGIGVERQVLRRAFGDGAGGTTLEGLSTLAKSFGLDAEGFELPVDRLTHIPVPAILHWNNRHFVVFEGFREKRLSIVDPVRGRALLDRGTFAALYGGVALAFEVRDPGSNVPAKILKHATDRRLSLLLPWMRRQRQDIARLAGLGTLMGAVISAGALSIRWAIDGAAGSSRLLAGAAVAAAIIACSISIAAGRLEVRLVRSLGDHLIELLVGVVRAAPHEYLGSRRRRFFADLAAELDPLVNDRVPSPAGIRLALIALASYAALLTIAFEFAGVVAGVAAALLIIAESRWRAEKRAGFAPRSRSPGRDLGAAILAHARTLRAGGVLVSATEKWTGVRRYVQASSARVTAISNSASPVLTLCAGLLVLWCAAVLIEMNTPVNRGLLLSKLLLATIALATLQGATIEAHRLRKWVLTLDVLGEALDEVPPESPGEPLTAPQGGGALRCRSVAHFAMGQRQLADVDLEVLPGGGVAIVGDAGARAMFAAIVLGQVHPSRGTVMIDGFSPSELPEIRRRKLVAGVTAGIPLLAETIMDNFRIFDSTCNAARVTSACRAAGLGEWLDGLPLREETQLLPSMLVGSVPRLLYLACLLVSPPGILVLDGTLDELETGAARAIVRSLLQIGPTLVLCTSRPDIALAAELPSMQIFGVRSA